MKILSKVFWFFFASITFFTPGNHTILKKDARARARAPQRLSYVAYVAYVV